jgi:hypothetical protein
MEDDAVSRYLAQAVAGTEPPSDREVRSMAQDAVARAQVSPTDSHRSPLRRGARLALLAAAFAVVAGSTAATAALVIQDDPEPPADLERAVVQLFAAGQCVTAVEATDLIGAQLTALGYDNWTVAPGDGVQAQSCVAPGFVASDEIIVLVAVDQPNVVAAIDGVRETLMSSCFNEAEARELISSTLTSIGVTGWEIRTDGPLAYPTGEEKAVRDHIAAGCFVYSGSGQGPNGAIYYISGGA